MNHVSAEYQVKEKHMEAYLQKVKDIMRNFKTIKFILILRSENHKADVLAS